jgi:predicted PurR-regulated permease PerM
MDRRLFATLVAFAALLGAIYLLFQIVGPFLAPIGWAAVIAIVTHPLYRRLRTVLGGRELAAASLMTAAVVALLILPTIGLIVLVVQELLRVRDFLDQAAVDGHMSGMRELLDYPPIARAIERLRAFAAPAGIDLRARAMAGAQALVSFLLANATAMLKNVALLVFQILLIWIALFFLYKDGERLEQALWELSDVPERMRTAVRGTATSVVGAVAIGVLATAAVQGLLGGIGFWVSGLPSPLLFGVLMAVSALIPVVGAAIIWVPAVAYLFISGDTLFGVVLLVWCLIAVSGIDNIMRPLLISGRTGLPLSLMMLGAIGGLMAFGLEGLVLGPFALALVVLAVKLKRLAAAPADAGPG